MGRCKYDSEIYRTNLVQKIKAGFIPHLDIQENEIRANLHYF